MLRLTARRARYLMLLALITSAVSVGASSSDNSFSSYLADTELMISGQKTLTYRYAFALGKEANQFFNNNYLARGGTIEDQSTFLMLNGMIGKNFYINGTLSDGTYMGSQAQIELKGPNFGVNLGDITADFGGSEFGRFNRNLNGLKFDAQWGRTKAFLITSQIKSETITERFAGNAYGLYTLRYNLIPGSETVWVNNELQRPNLDYRVEKSQIRFFVFHDSADTITVTYEYSLFFSFNPGMITGVRAESQISDKWNLGATFLRSSTNKYVQETGFYEEFSAGNDSLSGDVSGPYQLRYWPIVRDTNLLVTIQWGDTPPLDSSDDRVDIDYELGLVTLYTPTLPGPGELITISYYYKVAFPEGEPKEFPAQKFTGDAITIDYGEPITKEAIRVYLKKEGEDSLGELAVVPPVFLKIDGNTLEILAEYDYKDEYRSRTWHLVNPAWGQENEAVTVEVRKVSVLEKANSLMGEEEDRVDHTVLALDTQYQVNPNIQLTAELGLSEADLSIDAEYFKKTIPLNSQSVRAYGSGLYCLDLSSAHAIIGEGKPFPLPIEPGSESLYLRRGDSRQRLQAKYYEINYNDGLIIFYLDYYADELEEGFVLPDTGSGYDELELEYQYITKQSLKSSKMAFGTAYKVGATANYAKASVVTNYRYLDPQFRTIGLPRTVGGSSEVSNFKADVTLRPVPYLSLSNTFNQYEHLQWDEKMSQTRRNISAVSLNYPHWPSLTFYQSQVKEGATSQRAQELSAQYGWRIFMLSGSIRQNQNLTAGLNTNTFTQRFGLKVTPSAKVDAGWDYIRGGETLAENESHEFTMNIRPLNQLSIVGGYLFRRRLDTQTAPYEQANLTLTAKPTAKHNITLGLGRTSDPLSVNFYTNDSLRTSWKYEPMPAFALTTSYNTSKRVYHNDKTQYLYDAFGTTLTLKPPRWQTHNAKLEWKYNYSPKVSRDASFTFSRLHAFNLSMNVFPNLNLTLGYENRTDPYREDERDQYGNIIYSYWFHKGSNAMNLSANYQLYKGLSATGTLRWIDYARASYWNKDWISRIVTGQRLESKIGLNYTVAPGIQVNVDYELEGLIPTDGEAPYYGNIITTRLVGSF